MGFILQYTTPFGTFTLTSRYTPEKPRVFPTMDCVQDEISHLLQKRIGNERMDFVIIPASDELKQSR